MCLPQTLNVQMGKKLRDKTEEDIIKAVERAFNKFCVTAIQICHEIIRVLFVTKAGYENARKMHGVYLFGMFSPIAGGGPLLPCSIFLTILTRRITWRSGVYALILALLRV